MTNFILTLHCKDKPGIVAAVATNLSNADCNIEGSAQFNDNLTGHFFMRVVLKPLSASALESFQKNFQTIATEYQMEWQLHAQDAPLKTVILVSKTDHCLNDLLYRWRTQHLNIDIAGVISNHETNRSLVESRGIPFHHLPVSADTKPDQEQKIKAIVEDTGAELIVLARYMQVFSDDICRHYEGKVINIHHSFLPGFKGANPYRQAYERGVKLIGATAHFATADLDEGPIIEQDVVRINHSYDPARLQALGRDTEARVLAKAIEMFSERRIFSHGSRTVIL